ncbi:MAG: rhodanese-like domain-containing protein [bacterium]
MSRRAREALALVVAAVLIGFGLNGLRDDPLPLTGSLKPPPVPEPGAGLPARTREEALRSWEDGALFLDVRPRDAYDARRVAGAISFEAERAEDRYFEAVAPLGADVPLFVYGAGPDSFAVRRVTAELRDLGHQVDLAVCGLDELIGAGIAVEEGPAEGTP